MINDLLDLARLESGQTRQRLEVVSPQTLIDDALPNLSIAGGSARLCDWWRRLRLTFQR